MFKNSIKFIIRSPIRTIIFTVLIAAVSVMLYFGVSLWDESYNGIQRAKEKFKTIAVFTPIEAENLSDIDLSPLYNSEYLSMIDNRNYLTAYSDDITLNIQMKHFTNNFTIFEVERISEKEEIEKFGSLSDKYSYYKISNIIYGGHTYVYRLGEYIHISNYMSNNPHMDIRPLETVRGHKYLMNLYSTVPPLFFTTSSFHLPKSCTSYVDITDGIDKTDESYKHIMELVDTYKNNIKTVGVTLTDDINMILRFHQNEMKIVEGRSFVADEYKNGNNVCVISKELAFSSNLKIGDSIEINITDAFKPEKALNNATAGTSMYDSRDTMAPSRAELDVHNVVLETKSYEIIGLFDGKKDNMSYFDVPTSTIIAPKNSVSEEIINKIYSSENLKLEHDKLGDNISKSCLRSANQGVPYRNVATLSCMLRTSEDADNFLEEMKETGLSEKVQITLYDQGYKEVAKPLKEMQKVALILIGSCLAGSIIVIVSFVYFSIIKRKHDVAIMLSLGTSKFKSIATIIIGIFIIAIFGSMLGSLIGDFCYENIRDVIYEEIDRLKNETITYYSPTFTFGESIKFSVEETNGHGGILTISIVVILTLAISIYGVWNLARLEPLLLLSKREVK